MATTTTKRTATLKTHVQDLYYSSQQSSMMRFLRPVLPEWNFLSIHYTYFILTTLLTSILFYLTSRPSYSITYTDSLFLVVSAMTEAGLNTVNLSQMTSFQQGLLFVLIFCGSSIFVSIATVGARKRVFERRLGDVVRRQREGRGRSGSGSRRGLGGRGKRGDRSLGGERGGEGQEFESRHSEPRDPPPRPEGDVVSGDTQESRGKDKGLDLGLALNEKVNGGLDESGKEGLDERHIQHAPSAIPLRTLQSSSMSKIPHTSAYEHPAPLSNGLTSRLPKTPLNSSKTQEDTGGLDNNVYPTYLTRHTTGRNAQFFGLTRAEREHLGGVEYRAISLLAWVVPIYFLAWQFFGCVGLGWYMASNRPSIARENGINPWWLGAFNAVSAFNNSGMSLLDANMIPFQTSVYTLLTMGLLILAGNTAYPLFLRLILWTLLRALCLIYPSPTRYAEHKATLRFILTYPRRVYTNLFPSTATWWLLFVVILLNSIDWAAFELLNIGNPATTSIPGHFRVLDGLFQALAVRSGGFYVVSITSLRIGLQVLYVVMMYISVYPVVITLRHSNVYEEMSLGIYASPDSDTESDDDEESSAGLENPGTTPEPKLGKLASIFQETATRFGSGEKGKKRVDRGQRRKETGKQFIRQQLHNQLSHDLWLLILAILLITCIEVSNFNRDPITYSVFNIAFEVVSGYGCVGISTGLPNEAFSFSGGWHKASKLVLVVVMLRGRHRGLPVSLDRAVRLPGEMREFEGGGVGREGSRRSSFRMGSRGREMGVLG